MKATSFTQLVQRQDFNLFSELSMLRLVAVTRGFGHGASRRTRTPDLLITNQLHYQLCYTGVWLLYEAELCTTPNESNS